MVDLKLCAFVILAVLAICYAIPETVMEPEPLDCPANEAYFKCDLEQCFKTCADLKRPPPCPAIAPGCIRPACLCARDLLRNSNGVCVPYEECS